MGVRSLNEGGQGGREGAAGFKARQLSSSALCDPGRHDSSDLRSQLIILMALNGPKCFPSLDRTHLEPAGGLAPVTAGGYFRMDGAGSKVVIPGVTGGL